LVTSSPSHDQVDQGKRCGNRSGGDTVTFPAAFCISLWNVDSYVAYFLGWDRINDFGYCKRWGMSLPPCASAPLSGSLFHSGMS
jgi:hypothetical protein